MGAAIRARLVPAALALGWVPLARQPGGRGERRHGEFEFERLGADRIERIGLDFQYGDRPDVWLSLAVWTGEGGVCTLFQTGDCWNYSDYGNPWRWLLARLRRKPASGEIGAEALAKGLQRLQIVERYLHQGVGHPDLRMIQTLPPYRWPEGYGERM